MVHKSETILKYDSKKFLSLYLLYSLKRLGPVVSAGVRTTRKQLKSSEVDMRKSSVKETSVLCGTNKLVDCAYFNRTLTFHSQ